MIKVLTGDNYYLIAHELNKLREGLGLTNNEFGISVIYGAETSLEDIKNELSSYSLFSENRLIELFEPSRAKGFEDYITNEADSIPEETTVAIIEPALDKRRGYYKFLKSKTEFKEFPKLSTAELNKWSAQYIKEQGGEISSSDVAYLVDRLGDDQMLLSKEIDKLITYSPKINKESLDLLTEQSISSTIFELLDAAFHLNSKKALSIYNEQRLQKMEPEQILAMVSWQLNTLAVYMAAKDLQNSEIISGSGLSPYTLSKARQISSTMSFGGLMKLVDQLSNIDYGSKTGSLDLDEALKNFIVGLEFQPISSL